MLGRHPNVIIIKMRGQRKRVLISDLYALDLRVGLVVVGVALRIVDTHNRKY